MLAEIRNKAILLFDKRILIISLLGFSAGIPLLLIFSSLSLWLNEAGVAKSSVTMFSWAALGYSFKFVWAPLVDRMPVPLLSTMIGLRRSWILASQLSIIGAVLYMSSINPALDPNALKMMAIGAVWLGFSSATQDIVIDAYRIESAPADFQGLLAAGYTFGYRIAMVASGAGALYLASWFGSEKGAYDYKAWQLTYQCMAAVMLIGIATTIIMPSARYEQKNDAHDRSLTEYLRFCLMFVIFIATFVSTFIYSGPFLETFKNSFTDNILADVIVSFLSELLRLILSMMAGLTAILIIMKAGLVNQEMVDKTYIMPIKDFFTRYPVKFAILLLCLIGCYRMSDIVLGVIANLFYQDIGYTKKEIASAAKTFGVIVLIASTFIGGYWISRAGVIRVLLIGSILVVLTNLLFLVLSGTDNPSFLLLCLVLTADNFSAGIATAAFIGFLSSLVNIKFTAMQYAIFSSLMTLFPKVLGGYSGSIVESIGYPKFFIFVSILGIPAILLTLYLQKFISIGDKGLIIKDD